MLYYQSSTCVLSLEASTIFSSSFSLASYHYSKEKGTPVESAFHVSEGLRTLKFLDHRLICNQQIGFGTASVSEVCAPSQNVLVATRVEIRPRRWFAVPNPSLPASPHLPYFSSPGQESILGSVTTILPRRFGLNYYST